VPGAFENEGCSVSLVALGVLARPGHRDGTRPRVASRSVRLAYVVSRFPLASETFIVRELNALEERHGADITLLALFAPDHPFVHRDAERWMPRVHRVNRAAGVRGLCRWLVRRPVATLRILAEIVWAYAAHPGLLTRALATVPLGCAHALGVERAQIRHVHAHFATYPALTAWICSRLTGSTFSVTAHAHDLFVHQAHLRAIVHEASFVVTISEFNRRFLAPYGGGDPTPVHVVRCGVDPDRYRFAPRAPPTDGRVRALCVASLEEYKGHRILLDALAVGGAVDRIDVDVVGAGSRRSELEAQAGRLGLTGRVRFLGVLDESAVAALLAETDLFVLPSVVAADRQMEGIPVALMEALACGVPTVASRLSGIPELVQDEITGLLAEPGDAVALAGALERTLANPAAARRRAVAGRALVEGEYDVRRSADELERLFSAALARR